MQAPFFSQSLNRYSYAFNNPLSFVDPTGYQATGEFFFDWMDGGTPTMPTSDDCVAGPGCVQIEVGQLNLHGIYNDTASGEPFGHREPGPPGLGLGFSLDVSDLRPGYALGSRWNPHSSLGQAGRDVFGADRPIATWSPSPEMARAAIGWMPIPVSMITWCRRTLTKSRWTDPALSSSRAAAATTSSARSLSLINIAPSS
ncbi:uncharacterized protein SOCE26_001910 [Sorangium cellulosum]|uniref:RHS repeat-associated core domain-containing protein n=1 Tax=Sorangium cellulosum TaxID=56 RepID=A0A2L0EHQ3_SORCE|nr:uncharacterized protein SOCE26_001910 [Sorangium cellulosum]